MKKVLLLLSVAICVRITWANNINVPPGGNLQAALNTARSGDTVILAAGATYTGHFYLPPNNGSQWITIQSSAMSSLAAAGNRVSPAQASAMPKLITPDGAPALAIANGANYYRVQGIEFGPAAGIYGQDLIQVGTGAETSNNQLPHDLDFDRDYIHGDSSAGSKRGVALNGINVTVENCYLSAFTSNYQDTQAIAGWNGPGPYTIANNYLEAGTEIVAFGGAAVSIYGNIPSDITIRNNTFFKSLSWRPGDPSYAGANVLVKNHVELKNAQRVTIDGNTFANNWIGADQQGFLFLFSVRTEGGAVPWAVVNNVTVKNNAVRHAAAGIYLTGHDGTSGSAGNFQIQNNIWEDISGNWGGDGRLFEILNDVNGVTFDHNTAFQTGYAAVFDEAPSRNINFTNNSFNLGWGVVGNSQFPGIPTLAAYAGGGVFAGNLLIGATNYQYPANNFFAPSIAQVDFINPNAENFLLASNSPYKGMATDGGDIGSSLPTATQPSAPAPGPAIPTGWVNVVSKNSGKCMDIYTLNGSQLLPSTKVQQGTCWGGDMQKFQFSPVNGGYEVTGKVSGLQLDVLGGPSATGDGVPLIQWPYWGGTNEIFQLNPTSDGYYTINPLQRGKCLDVSGNSTADGARIIQYTCLGDDNQKWSLNPAQ